MQVKGKRVLKNGAVAGYVYYSQEKNGNGELLVVQKKKRGWL